jgi:hypothetical protein
MADERYHGMVPTPPPTLPASAGQYKWPSAVSISPNAPMRWVSFTALAVALLSLGISVASCLLSTARSKPTTSLPVPMYTNQQTVAAKTDVCPAYQQVRRALDAAGARNGSTDPTASLAVATASRQALDVGSRYLLTKLTEEPAANPDLAAAIRKLADLYQQITVSYLADINESEIHPLREAADQAAATIDGQCK